MAKANLLKRIVAYVIDSILAGAVSVVLLVVVMVAFWVVTMIGALAQSPLIILLSSIGMFVAVFILLIPMVVYVLIRDGLFGGRSIGKKLMGLRVVNVKSNKPCSIKDSVLRNITLLVPVLGFIEMLMPLVDANGLRFGDKIAGTQVTE